MFIFNRSPIPSLAGIVVVLLGALIATQCSHIDRPAPDAAAAYHVAN